MNNYEPINQFMERMSQEKLDIISERLCMQPCEEEIERQRDFYKELIKTHADIPTGKDMVILSAREVHMIQIVMRLLRKHKIFSHTPNVEVFDMVKQEYYNDVHRG